MKGQEMGVAEREDELDTEQPDTTEVEEQEDIPGDGEEEAEGEGTEGAESADGEGEEETVVSFGSEEPPASEEETAGNGGSPVIRDLRRRYRELSREAAELRAKLNTGNGAQQPQGKPVVPDYPKMSDPDIDFDEEKHRAKVEDWHAKKRDADAWEANQRSAVEAQQKRVQAINEGYANSIKALGVKDYQDAEDAVAAELDATRQAILKAGASNPGALVYALGRNPKKLQELASIKDPVKFAVAVGKLETEVKVSKRTSTKPAPETSLKGGGNTSSASSKATLERLRAEADKTGDRSKVAAFLKQQRTSGK